jgi:hypothetical protein
MASTLYILRKQPSAISPTLFQLGEADMEVVFIERVPLISPAFENGSFVSDKKVAGGSSVPTITYDDLIMKIFSFDHIVVL